MNDTVILIRRASLAEQNHSFLENEEFWFSLKGLKTEVLLVKQKNCIIP